MFKWVFSGAILVMLLIQNWLLKQDLKIEKNYQERLHEQTWAQITNKHVQVLREMNEMFGNSPNRWPLWGYISSPFGFRVNPFTGYQSMHYGIDIVAVYGTPVRSTAAGRVKFVGDGGLLGKMIVIEHPNNFLTQYGHLSQFFVHEGQRVVRGQKIAQVGNTGRSTGAHLHYGIRKDEVYVDPREYLE